MNASRRRKSIVYRNTGVPMITYACTGQCTLSTVSCRRASLPSDNHAGAQINNYPGLFYKVTRRRPWQDNAFSAAAHVRLHFSLRFASLHRWQKGGGSSSRAADQHVVSSWLSQVAESRRHNKDQGSIKPVRWASTKKIT